jgi:hypothetical protein
MNSRAATKASVYVDPASAAPVNGEPTSRGRGQTPVTRGRTAQIAAIKNLIAKENAGLLQHRYFDVCRTGSMGRAQLVAIMKELYCFSVFYERILTLRVARHSTTMDARSLEVARQHLEEEFGHVRLFRTCLLDSGVSPQELSQLAPKTLTKALYGYLLATVLHENDYVINVAVTLVMESIGYHFFQATSAAMKLHQMSNGAAEEHATEDAGHAVLGIELAARFDEQTMRDSQRVIRDLYRLMPIVFDEWLAAGKLALNAGTA